MIGVILDHRYQILKLIGSGGMAHVYLAINLSNHKNVAIKVLKPEYCENPEFLRRFEREAKTVLHLNQENIVHAYGVGEYNGNPYIVLEYVEGKTLKTVLQERGVLSQKTAVSYALQVLNALQAAHEAGIIHRDVKPQNVIITPGGKAKLTDFGIAREVEASTQTFAGSNVIGSAHYLSPEQAKGAPVSEESDLYSVGVMLYEMLTGTVPFQGDTTVAVALKHINEEAHSPMDLNPSIYPSVNEVILRALKKDASLRFRSAKQMKRALTVAAKDPASHPAQVSAEVSSEVDSFEFSGRRLFRDNYSHIPLSIKIGIIVLGIIIAFVGMFFGIRYVVSAENQSKVIVPTLIGKTLEEAQIKAQNYGLELAIVEYEVNDEYPYGCIISQDPAAGQRTREDSIINVNISAGSNIPTVPSLIGKTHNEALQLIKDSGYVPGNVSYQMSDTAIGYVCSQSPIPGTELPDGNPIDFSISANISLTFEMPNVTLSSLEDSIQLIDSLGDVKILICYQEMEEGDIYGNVVLQKPAAGSIVQSESLVTLYVSGKPGYPCSQDVAYSIDIPENETNVILTISDTVKNISVERIVYENILEAGEKIPLAVTVFAPEAGLYELTLYENNKEIWRKDLTFEERPDA